MFQPFCLGLWVPCVARKPIRDNPKIFTDLQSIFLNSAIILEFANLFGIYKIIFVDNFNSFIKSCNSFSDLINSSTMILQKKYLGFKNIFSNFVNILGLSLIGFCCVASVACMRL